MSRERLTARSIGISDGINAFLNGIGFVLGTPRVWGYAAVPVCLALLLSCLLMGGAFYGADQLGQLVMGQVPEGWSNVARWAVTISLGLLLAALGVLVALSLAQPLSGWALEAIARAQERALTGYSSPEPSFAMAMWLAFKVSLFTLLVGSVLLGLLFLVGFFFPPATLVTVPLKFLILAWLVAWNFIDYPLGLRGEGLRSRFQWAYRHFSAFTTFGLLWAAVLTVPGMALFILPMGVAGATRLVVATDGVLSEEQDW